MGGLNRNFGRFLLYTLNLVIAFLAALSLGFSMGASFYYPRRASTIQNVLNICSVLAAGFYVNLLPPWIGWVRFVAVLSFLR